jgi:DNA helicase-2/ATP-dependent DNA helicase PcrA
LVALAEDFTAARPDAGLRDFLAELEERASAQHAPTVEGVTLASLHAAKGLEWDAVFLVGLTEGMLPITYAETPGAIEEERRLMYVGVTRAREHLFLSWAAARSPGGRGGRRPSRFLDGVRPAGGSGTDTSAPRSGRRAARVVPTSCRICSAPLSTPAQRKVGRCSDCPPTYDEAMFERLRAWRAERAREGGVPAYVVFTDATLTAIAEARPDSERALLAIAGVGSTKLERYGAEVLALVAGTAAEDARG